uniref:Uncharacterized protein n=1 Tax=Rhizophora mucronata TaxID=61149 RepID=A0A2P2NFU1_RHIMU
MELISSMSGTSDLITGWILLHTE